jgi:SanA protein
MKRRRKIFLTILVVGLLGVVWLFSVNWYVQSLEEPNKKHSVEEIPSEEPPRVAIVLGAKVWANGEPSDVLYDRVLTAVELYQAGKVRKLLMSGDNPSKDYDEPTAMLQTAIKLGVPESDIVLDFAGRRTYDTCYRAKEIFAVQKAVIVTQDFHQARSLYLCNSMGVESFGIVADKHIYLGSNYWAVREIFSVFSAWFEVNFIPFAPIGGKKEPIE